MNEAFDLAWRRAKFEVSPGRFLFGWHVRGVNKSPGAFLPKNGRAISLIHGADFLTLEPK